jgi:hypothetical protein
MLDGLIMDVLQVLSRLVCIPNLKGAFVDIFSFHYLVLIWRFAAEQ